VTDESGCYLTMVQGRVPDASPLHTAHPPLDPMGLPALWEDVRGSWAASREVGRLDYPFLFYEENLTRFLRDVAPYVDRTGDLVAIAHELSKVSELDYLAVQAWAIRVANGDMSALDEAVR